MIHQMRLSVGVVALGTFSTHGDEVLTNKGRGTKATTKWHDGYQKVTQNETKKGDQRVTKKGQVSESEWATPFGLPPFGGTSMMPFWRPFLDSAEQFGFWAPRGSFLTVSRFRAWRALSLTRKGFLKPRRQEHASALKVSRPCDARQNQYGKHGSAKCHPQTTLQTSKQ